MSTIFSGWFYFFITSCLLFLNLKQKASSIDFSLESSNWWFKPLSTIWTLMYSGLNDNVATLRFMKLYFTRIYKNTLIFLSKDFSLHLIGDVVISCIKEKNKNSRSHSQPPNTVVTRHLPSPCKLTFTHKKWCYASHAHTHTHNTANHICFLPPFLNSVDLYIFLKYMYVLNWFIM